MQNIVDLLGKTVSFVSVQVVGKKLFRTQENGTVTDVILNAYGDHQISINNGDIYSIKDLLELQIA